MHSPDTFSIKFLVPSLQKKRFFLLFFLIGLIPVIAEAQLFSVYDIDKEDYPVIRARYLYIDEEGEPVYDFSRKDLKVFEYGEQARILSLKNPQKSPPKKLSVVLTFDVSSSMDKERMDIARAAGLSFIDLLPLEVSECAVSSFDHMNYLNCDFTHSEKRLKEAVKALRAQGGTSYNSGFVNPYSGAFQIAKEGKYKKVVIFLTDGLGEGNESEIIRQAEKHGITVYPVTVGLKVPNVLKNIALKSGGRYFGEVTDTSRAKEIYNQILINAQSFKAGEIAWQSPNGCHKQINTTFSYKEHTVESAYNLTEQQRVRLDIKPVFIQFESSDSANSRNIKVGAVNADFKIRDVVLENKQGFTMDYNQSPPFQIGKDAASDIRLNYEPSAAEEAFSPIRIVNDQCPDYYVYAKAGAGENAASLELLTPNGGEIYSAGLEGGLKWKGISERDSVAVYFSPDRGDSWEFIDMAGGLSDKWEIPAVEGMENLIRVEQNENQSRGRGIEPLLTLSGEQIEAHNARFVGNGNYIITTGVNNSMKLWNANTGEYIRSFLFHNDWVYDAVGSPDGSRIVSASDDGSATIFTPEGNMEQHRLSVNYSGINKAIFSSDGEEVITAGDDGAIRLWNANTGRHLYGIRAHRGWVLDVAMSPDGELMASGGDDGLLRTFRYTTDRVGRNIYQMTLAGHKGWIMDVEFSPDGSKILSASKDGTARIWDASSGKVLHTFTGHNNEVYSAGFSPDGNRILTAGRDGTVRLWDVASKHMVHMLKAEGDTWYRRAYFGPGGNRIITITNEREVKVWVINDTKPFQKDVSDNTFQIVSPKPDVKEVDFGSHFTGRSVDTLIPGFFTNKTDHALKINHVFISGRDKTDFSLVSGHQSFILPPGNSRDIELNYSPRMTGNRKSYVGVVTPTDTIKAPLTGTGIEKAYDLPVERLNFGSLNIGQERDTTVIFLENRGNTSLTAEAFNISGSGASQFDIDGEPEENQVSPGSSKSINLVFNPHQGGRTSAVLNFTVDDNEHRIYLFGEGLAPREIQLEGKVLEQSSDEPLSASIRSFDLNSNRLLDSTFSGEKGNYSLTMNPGRTYRILADKEGYIPGSIHLDLTGTTTEDKMVRNIYLSSIDTGATVVLNNIFFEYAKARLTETSKAELDRMSRFLEDNPGISVQLSGHTDSIGTHQDNLLLSRQRAGAVRDYLVKSGISAERITTKGYGETKPLADNDTPEGRQKNRRVEFTITDRSDTPGQ